MRSASSESESNRHSIIICQSAPDSDNYSRLTVTARSRAICGVLDQMRRAFIARSTILKIPKIPKILIQTTNANTTFAPSLTSIPKKLYSK